MSAATTANVDVAIFGGGVAGLWLLARLRRAGYNAVLLESQALGAGQTRYAQGIIHGGTKYALTGKLSASAEAVAAMPGIWRDCMAGKGELDLRAVKVLSPHQYLWSTATLTSRMAGFFGSKLMRSRTQALAASARPAVFRDPRFRGQIYRLEEPVLDTASIVAALAEPHREAIYTAPWPEGVELHADGTLLLKQADGRSLQLTAQRLVFAAGAGNAALLQALGHATPAMQRRPLQMVMLRGELPEGVYAHCLGASANPRITITTHYDAQGTPVWYLGGQLAEEGVGRSDAEQIAVAREELGTLLPWIDLSDVQWATLPIDRAEPQTADGSRPETAFAEEADGVITAWPTKLALAPMLAARILELLQRGGMTPGGGETPAWPFPGYAPLPWQEETRWS